MPLPRLALTALVGSVLMSVPARGVMGQKSFQTSLTATISRLAPEGATPSSDSLGCRHVSLHWRELAGAHRYVVYVSSTGREPWMALPSRNACGPSDAAGPTSVTDVEPTTRVAAGARTIYYKVVALTGSGASERTLETTAAVSVQLR